MGRRLAVRGPDEGDTGAPSLSANWDTMYKRISLTICLVTLLSQFGCGSDAPSTMVMDPAMIGPAAGTGPASPAGTGKACEQITVDPSFAKNLCNNPHDKCLETTN